MPNENSDPKTLEIFLYEMENDIKSAAIRFSLKRKVEAVDFRDVRKALRTLAVELFRNRKGFAKYGKRLSDDKKALIRMLQSLQKPRILDVGCGWGRASIALNKQIGKKSQIVGIDIDPFCLKYGKSLNSDAFFLKAHMNWLPFRHQAFDLVLSSKALHEIENADAQRRALVELGRVLDSSGLIYVFEPLAKSQIAKTVLQIFHRIFPRMEAQYQMSELEEALKQSRFRIVKKSCFLWSTLSLRAMCSYIAVFEG